VFPSLAEVRKHSGDTFLAEVRKHSGDTFLAEVRKHSGFIAADNFLKPLKIDQIRV
jgi:hypothetical protein